MTATSAWSGTCPERNRGGEIDSINLLSTHPLFDGVIRMFCCITDNLESQSGVVKVSTVCVQMLEVVLEEQFVLRQPEMTICWKRAKIEFLVNGNL